MRCRAMSAVAGDRENLSGQSGGPGQRAEAGRAERARRPLRRDQGDSNLISHWRENVASVAETRNYNNLFSAMLD